MLRKCTLSMAALLLATACGVDESLEQAYVEAEQRHEQLTQCDDDNYDYWRYMADLAVVAAAELGRWNAVADFERHRVGRTHYLRLSETGRQRCGECLNTLAILQLQRRETEGLPRHNPAYFRDKLLDYHYRNFWRMLMSDAESPETVIEDHHLELTDVTEDICGSRYHYRVTSAANGQPLEDLDSLSDALIFAGNPENLYLGFQTDPEKGEVSIDPAGSVVASGSDSSGSCRAGSAIYFSERDISGSCCVDLEGTRGGLARTTFNEYLFECEAWER